MPTIASVSVKYSRKYQVRKDDWAGFEALITLTVSEEEANLTDPHEVAAEAFAIARQAVGEQFADLRRQFAEAAERRAERRAASSTPAPAPVESIPPSLPVDQFPACTDGHVPPAELLSLRTNGHAHEPLATADDLPF